MYLVISGLLLPLIGLVLRFFVMTNVSFGVIFILLFGFQVQVFLQDTLFEPGFGTFGVKLRYINLYISYLALVTGFLLPLKFVGLTSLIPIM